MKMKKVLIMIIFVTLFISCNSEDGKTGTIPDENILERDGDSAAIPDNDEVDEDQELDITSPVTENGMTFEFKGMINGGDVDDGKGLAEFTVYLNGDSISLNIDPVARILEGEGGDLLRVAAFNKIEEMEPLNNMEYVVKYSIVSATISLETLIKMKKTGAQIVPADDIYSADYYDATLYKREEDGKRFVKFCQIGVLARENGDSKILVDHSGNRDFKVGENIIAKGNLALTDDTEAITKAHPDTEEDEGKLCVYRNGDTYISKEDFYSEIAKVKHIVDCELPPEFLNPFSESYLTFEFNGLINSIDVQQGNNDTGSGEYTLFIDGKEYEITNQGGFGKEVKYGDTDYVAVMTFGPFNNFPDGGQSYDYMEIKFPLSKLKEMKESGENIIKVEDGVFPMIIHVDIKPKDDKFIGKVCPLAVATEISNSSFFICHENSGDFGAEDIFQLAGNVALTIDPDEIMTQYGIDDICYCLDENNNVTDCTEFDNLGV